MNADIIFVIDKTSSFSTTDWSNIKAFLNRTMQYASPTGKTRYGIITYNSTNTTELNLKNNVGGDNAPTYVNKMRQGSGTTANLGAAINAAISQFSANSDSTRKKVLIVIAGGDVSGSPCQYNPRDYDIFTYVIALGTTWVRKNVKCLAMSENNYQGYFSTVSSTSSLSPTIYQNIELAICPHQPDIRITEVQPSNSSYARYVEFYNFGHALTTTNLSFSGLFNGYTSATVSQGQYFVLYNADDTSYVNCTGCSCTKLSSYSSGYWCSSAVYLGCGTTSASSWETVRSTCSVQKSYYATTSLWRMSISYSGTKIDNATYKSDSYWPKPTTNYAFEKRKKLYNSNYGSSWAQSCKNTGTPGQDPLTSCSYTCSITMCNATGGGTSCSGNTCACNTGYYSYDFTCNPLPPPSNCTGTVITSTQNEYEFDLARWDGTHYYSAYYCSAGSSTCTNYNRKTTYGPPVSIDNEKSSIVTTAMTTQYTTSSSTTYSTTSSCTLSTLSPTTTPTASPTHSVPVISKCNITLNGAKTQYTVYWVTPTYDSNGPSSSELTGYAIYEDGVRVVSTTTPTVLTYTGTWQQSSTFNTASDYVSVSGIWSTTDITDTRESSAAKVCTTYTQSPTAVPTRVPTGVPTKWPTGIPTANPTPGPTYANVTIPRCSVTYESNTDVLVNWTIPAFTTETITSSNAQYFLKWTSGGVTQTTSWSGFTPPQPFYIGTYPPDNVLGPMYMYVYWAVGSTTGRGPSTQCTITTLSPTAVPTTQPTSIPTNVPTKIPTNVPTDAPTNVPTPCPTITREILSSCSVIVGKLDTQGNFSFPLLTISSTTPDAKHIQYQFKGDSFSTIYVTQDKVAKTTDGSYGYQLVSLKSYDRQNASSYFEMYVAYTNLSCGQVYEYGPVTCSVYTAAPSVPPTPAPSSLPTASPTYGAVQVSFARYNLEYCQQLSCNYSSQTPIQLANEGSLGFLIQRSYTTYTYNITVVYNFSFVNNTVAEEYNFTGEIDPYLYSLNRTANLTDIVNWKIPNDSYWSNDLYSSSLVGPTYGDIGQWSGTAQILSPLPTSFLYGSFTPESELTTVRDYDGEVFMLTLTSCTVDSYAGPHDNDNTTCLITYPSQIFVVVKDGNTYVTIQEKTTKNKSYQSWFWYVIAGIALLLALIGYFVYKWWVNKKMAEAQVTDVQGDIDAVINEQEKGFGNDLGKDNVNFNPLAQPLSHLQKPATNEWTTNTKPNHSDITDKAEVRVEKFNVKQEFGPQTVARRGDRI